VNTIIENELHKKGLFNKKGNKMKISKHNFILLLILAFTITLLFDSAVRAAPAWIDDHDYAIGDFCQTWYNPLDTFRCIDDHHSNDDNKPPFDGGEFWVRVYPHDPPVSGFSDGYGPEKNDWLDFGYYVNDHLHYRISGVDGCAITRAVDIEDVNPNFVLDNNRNDGGWAIPHVCFLWNYGDVAEPSVPQGNAYWNSLYTGYTPSVNLYTNCTVTTNCVSYGFHQYKSTNAISLNYTKTSEIYRFTDELNLVTGYADADYDTSDGDLCVGNTPGYHVWWIEESPENCAATKMWWKNGPGGVYSWSPAAPGNNSCPYKWSLFYQPYFCIYNP
jgi:hypothetical protein